MCGIIGFVDKKNRLSATEKEGIATKILKEIQHRGYDSSGIYSHQSVTLGHNRLAIIDTSKNAEQPFFNETRMMTMSYNGEIFNHLELRVLTEKHIYASRSDTETLMSLYEALGETAFGLIRGMFAVSFYDQTTEEILLAVDQFGIKPLYYIDTPDWFAWSSEIKALKFIPGISFSLDENRLYEYAIFRTTVGSQTMLKGINRLSPGELLRYSIKNDRIGKTKYAATETTGGNIEDMLKLSVSEHILSDVPVGLQLSGGVDSSLISVLATQSLRQEDVHSFSIGLADRKWNEFEYSRAVSKQIKTIHHEILFTQQQFCETLPVATYQLDEPINYPNTVPLMLLAREARKFVKVLLSGEGADEIFGGYIRYNELIKKGLDLHTLVSSNSFCSPKDVSSVFKIGSAHDLFERNVLAESLSDHTPASKLSSYDMKTFLPSLLLRQDKMGMASNLENRFPFLDTRLVAATNKLPDQEKLSGGKTKIALKEIARKYLSEEIVYRKKCGFGLPISDWLRDSSGLGKYLRLFSRPMITRSYLNYENISIYIQEQLSEAKDHSEILWVLITLEIWVKIFIDHESPQDIWSSLHVHKATKYCTP